MGRAPSAIRAAADRIVASVPGAVFSGIVGDAAHTFGYHVARDELPPTDGSVQLPLDQQGPGDAASALDISLPPDQMIAVTSRLAGLAVAGDSSLYALREFAGTLDGSATYAYDLAEHAPEYGWDSSHLWHIHLSGYRAYADDAAAWDSIASAFIGAVDGDSELDATQAQQLSETFRMVAGLANPSYAVNNSGPGEYQIADQVTMLGKVQVRPYQGQPATQYDVGTTLSELLELGRTTRDNTSGAARAVESAKALIPLAAVVIALVVAARRR